jgi:L-gulono-1,4-lactone dehydrogenase
MTAARAQEWRNWAGDQQCTPAAIRRPSTIAELQALIGEGTGAVRIAGSGHSFSDAVVTDGVLIELKRMGRALDVDADSSLVKVEGAVTIRELNEHLAAHGLALENLGDIDAQTIAGAISTATHGTGAALRNLSSQVAALELVLADGTILECDESDADLLRAARVGLGALGAIATVTLRCVPAFTLHGIDRPQPLDFVLTNFERLVTENEHFEFYVFPHCNTALTRTNNKTDAPARPRSRTRTWAEDVLLVNHVFGACCKLGRRFPAHIPEINRLVTKLAGQTRRTDRSDRIFTSPRLVRFTEMEYALPRERIPSAVCDVLELIQQRDFAVPFPIEIRTVAADDALLSTAHGRDSGYLAVHMFEAMEWEPYFRAVEALLSDLDGRPHWGKRHFQTAATLRPRYPEWDRFQAIRARLDPEGRFQNDYTRRVLG